MSNMMPGCFGMLMAYDKNDDHCLACQYRDDCGDKAYERLHALRDIIDVEKRISAENKDRVKQGKSIQESRLVQSKPRGDITLTDEHLDVVKRIGNKKAVARAINLLRRGIDGSYMKNAMRRQINPFSQEPPYFLYLACELLMNGGFDKMQLAKLFVRDEQAKMSIKTAYSHVAITLPILKEFGVVKEIGGRYELLIRESK